MNKRWWLVAVTLWVALGSLQARGRWVTLENCHFLVNRSNDGDSFHVSVKGKEYIFRLYFVDAPETTTEFRERVDEQAKYFGINQQQAVEVGELAKTFTREKLSGAFSVKTCWEDALGRSRLERFYGVVQTPTGDLGEQLVENGLARLHGIQAEPGGLTDARREWQKLNQLQQKAKREKVGAWGVNFGRATTRANQPLSSGDAFNAFFHPQRNPDATPQPAASAWPFPPRPMATPPAVIATPPAAPPQTARAATPATQPSAAAAGANVQPGEAKLDVNTAAIEQLQQIPGIGEVTAQRIIAARPFKSADDLRQVKGIGDKRYEKLRPYFN